MAEKKESAPALSADFIVSAASSRQFPDYNRPELVLLGRSNAGKSSLLNRWLGRRGLARVSQTPGRTRQINFFEVVWRPESPPFLLADLPGYGFAAGPRSETAAWGRLVADYLESGRPLKLALLLIDIRRAPQEDERNLLAWLEQLAIPALVVATKADKLAQGPRGRRLKELAGLLGRTPLAFSSVTGLGREDLIQITADYIWSPVSEGASS